MRSCLALIAFILLLGVVSAEPTVRNLGTPVKAMSIRGSLLVRDPVTSRPTFYSGMYTSAGTARLIRFDYAMDRVEYYPLPGTKGVYGFTEGPDGRIYVGTIYPARIFSFDPVTKVVTDHGSAGGEEYVFELRTGPDGRIYGCTYPNAKVVAYDPVTDRMEDLGSMHPTEKYCGSLAVADNLRVFCGIGTQVDLVVYDPVSKKKKSILPESYRNGNGADVHTEDNIVYASVEGTLLIYDAETYEIIMVIEPQEGSWIGTHRQMSGGPVLIHGLPGGNRRFNSTTHQLEPYYTPLYSTYDNETGIAYVRTGGRQIFQAHNLTSGELLSEVDVSKDGEGMMVFSLGTGPDGCIYGGSDSILHLFKYDPSTDILEDLGFPYPAGGGEFYSLHIHEKRLYMAAYSGSVLGVYEPSGAWNPGTSNDSNPRKIGTVGGSQNRPHALTSSADGKVFVGSEPDYGQWGGALSIYDPITDEFEVHRHIIPNQSVLSLTCGLDGWTIYGGSGIRGGTGTEPLVRRGHFFAWDVHKGEKVLDIIPVIGVDDIKSLATAPDGRIYGSAGSTLFIFDPVVGEIIHKQSAEEGEIIEMVVGDDDLIYGRTQRSIFRMKPMSGIGEMVRFELLYTASDRGRGIALDRDANIYFGVGTDVYVLESPPRFEAPAQDLDIYQDGLGTGWRFEASGADVDLSSTEMVDTGSCQKIDLSRFCTLQYLPPDPWNITLWEYGYLRFSVNPANSTLGSIVVTKTGSGSTESLSVLTDYNVTLTPNQWTAFSIPVQGLDWAFGSRLESLKFVVLGSGTFYLDSIYLAVSEVGLVGFLVSIAAAICGLAHGARAVRLGE